MTNTILALDIGAWCQSRFTHVVAYAYQAYIDGYELDSIYEYIEQELMDSLKEDSEIISDPVVLNDIAGLLEEEPDVDIDQEEVGEALLNFTTVQLSEHEHEECCRRFIKLRQSIISGFTRTVEEIESLVMNVQKQGKLTPVMVHADDNRVIFSLRVSPTGEEVTP